MEDKKIDILGSEWTIKRQSEAENGLLTTHAGYCDWTTRMIFVECGSGGDGSMGDMDKYYRKVLRHEIVHAFLVRLDDEETEMLNHLEIEFGFSASEIFRNALKMYYNYMVRRL